ncbi:MAG: carboxypeptidase-like regulatory domain-containing protein, partial [Muribaculaceae bacterium]
MFRIVLTTIISFWGFAAFAETISGIVVDENGECLPYSTIRIMRKPIATLGDAYGCFTIKSESINQSDTLSITYIGYEPMKLAVNGLKADSIQAFKLQPATNLLNEITVNQRQ